jgi:hypothetical protein
MSLSSIGGVKYLPKEQEYLVDGIDRRRKISGSMASGQRSFIHKVMARNARHNKLVIERIGCSVVQAESR